MEIKTFVFLTIEATGFPEVEYNQTKMVELAFIAVSREDLERATVQNPPETRKISFLFNPQRKLRLDAARVTGLTDDILADKPLFKDKVHLLNEFLDLPKPVCLVAHSGEIFDYRILKTEYQEVQASLPHDLVLVDSHTYFKLIFPKYSKHNGRVMNSLALRKLYSALLNTVPTGFNRADTDCEMLLECILAKKEKFFTWADKWNKTFEKIRSLR